MSSMRRYFNFRAVFLAALVGAIVLIAQPGYAQPADEASKAPVHVNPFAIVLENLDFVFLIICLCSVIGLTLIIQGFIKARSSVMMPEGTNNHIRELIGQRQFNDLIESTETDTNFLTLPHNLPL